MTITFKDNLAPFWWISLLLCVFALAGCQSVNTQIQPQTSRDAVSEFIVASIDEIGQRAVQEQGISGLSISVAQDGQLIYQNAFGFADLAQTRAIDNNTIFDVASVGKQFTAVAILKLAEDQKLSLDQRARAFVPELPAHLPNATIEQLLRHTSGFVGGDLDEFNPPEGYDQKRYGAELLTDVELQTGEARHPAGETWVYSNPGYLILGIIIERASGMRYDEYIRSALLDPAGLNHVLVLERAEDRRMAEALHRETDGLRKMPFIDMSAYSGQGSICSSTGDLIKWSQALNRGDVISPVSLARLRTPSELVGDSATSAAPYGMAQRMGTLYEHFRVGHTGTFSGGSAALFYFPDDGIEIAVLSNTNGEGVPHAYEIETEIAIAILGLEPPELESMEVALTEAQKSAITGDYDAGFSASFDHQGRLVVQRNGEILESGLIHIGDLQFRDPQNPRVQEWFEMDGGSVGWWVYSVSGSYLEVLRRAD